VRSARAILSAKLIVQKITPTSFLDMRKTSKPRRKTPESVISKFRSILSTFANTSAKMILRGRRQKKDLSKISRYIIKRKNKYNVNFMKCMARAKNLPRLSKARKIRSKSRISEVI
jgi:hypothetical protein